MAAHASLACVVGPYREAVMTENLEVETREGLVKLEIGPRHVLLSVGDTITLSVSERYATLLRHTGRKKPKKRSLKLQDARLLIARAIPTDDIGIWHESSPGVVQRLFGLRRHGLESDDHLDDIEDERRKLEQLIERLSRALARHGGGVKAAMEVGRGADRVLIMDHGEHLLFYIRRLFRERQRSAFEVHRDGTIAILLTGMFRPPRSEKLADRVRRPPYRFQCRFRFGVTTSGDFIRFTDHTGKDLGQISLPWISTEDRVELARVITEYIDHDAH